MAKLITQSCSICGKVAKAKSFFTLDETEYVSLECGHTVTQTLAKSADYSDFVSNDGRSLYPFQIEGCRFAERANFNCLIADEMGLGKTVQALAILKKHSELLPVLILTKTALKHQWFAEVVRWTGLVPQIIEGKDVPIDVFKVFIISIDLLKNLDWLDIFPIKTVIIDECQSIKNLQSKRTHTLRNFLKNGFRSEITEKSIPNDKEHIRTIATDLMKYHGVSERFKLTFADLGSFKLGQCSCKANKYGQIEGTITLSLKHIREDKESDVIETILHEIAHAITPGAGHRPIWSDTSKAIGGDGQAISYCDGTVDEIKENVEKINVIALSGTPIKNRIDEYFPILNILRPDIFYSPISFQKNWVGQYSDGRKIKSGKLLYPERFKEQTKDFIIRRERSEVLPDLPKINRSFHYSELSQQAERHYKQLTEEFIEYVDKVEGKVSGKNSGETLAFLTKMRHATGRAKIDVTVDFVDDFLFQTDRPLTIFVHHKDVGSELYKKLIDVCRKQDSPIPLMLTSDLSGDERGNIVSSFRAGKSRIMIASTLASGEGLNLQFCSDCIMVERQWNPANEEQAEGRFSRIDPDRKEKVEAGLLSASVNSTYMTAIGTIDEFFMKLVEAKRKIVNEAMTGTKANWDQDEILVQLSEMIVKHSGRAWSF